MNRSSFYDPVTPEEYAANFECWAWQEGLDDDLDLVLIISRGVREGMGFDDAVRYLREYAT